MRANKSFFLNLFRVGLSNIFILSSQVLVGLALPKILSVNNFGLYRKFMLYATYISLLHFGFVDGILIKYGGKDIESINKLEFRTILRFFLFIEFTIGLTIILTSILFLNGSYKVIFILLGIYSFLLNSVTFYQFFSQALFKFKVLSWINEIQAILISISIILLIILKAFKFNVRYNNYLYLFISVYFIIFIIYFFYYREYLFGKNSRLSEVKGKIIELFRTGIIVTSAYQLANITLNFDNQLVSMLFGNSEFAIYSFAYNLVSIIISVVLAISTVLFPYLNKQGKDKTILQYSRNSELMLFFVYFLLVFYYLVDVFIKLYLPAYASSLSYFRILLPGVAITTSITTIIFNHYKVTKDINKYLVNGCFALLFTSLLNYFCYKAFHSIHSLAIASLLTLLFWYGIEDIYFRKKYKIKEYKHYLYILIMTITFEVITMTKNDILGILGFVVLYFIISYILYPERFGSLLKMLFKVQKV